LSEQAARSLAALDRSPERISFDTLGGMAMGTRESEQAPLWIATSDLPRSPGHPFYARLNQVLDAAHFDRFVEAQCERFCAGDGASESAPRPVLPLAARRLF
jgi:hypothetical protein